MMGCNFVLALVSDPPTLYLLITTLTDVQLVPSLPVILAALQLGLLSLQFRQSSSRSSDICPCWKPIYSILLLIFCFPACLAILSCLLIFKHGRVNSIRSEEMNSFLHTFLKEIFPELVSRGKMSVRDGAGPLASLVCS